LWPRRGRQTIHFLQPEATESNQRLRGGVEKQQDVCEVTRLWEPAALSPYSVAAFDMSPEIFIFAENCRKPPKMSQGSRATPTPSMTIRHATSRSPRRLFVERPVYRIQIFGCQRTLAEDGRRLLVNRAHCIALREELRGTPKLQNVETSKLQNSERPTLEAKQGGARAVTAEERAVGRDELECEMALTSQ
jgi:hypothetical protein